MTVRIVSSLLGLLFLLMGCGALSADWYEHHHWSPLHAGLGIGLAVFGALILDPAHVTAALRSAVDAAKVLLPWNFNKPPGGGA